MTNSLSHVVPSNAGWEQEHSSCPAEDSLTVAYIELTKGYYATVDASDYAELMRHSWHTTMRANGHIYACRTYRKNGKSFRMYMHRQLTSPDVGLVVDHIDGDGLNNTRANLRVCTNGQNLVRATLVPGASGYRGVWKSRYGYSVFIQHNRVRTYVGYFVSVAEAALAYNAKATELFGEFAALNQLANGTVGCSWCMRFMDEHSRPVGNAIPQMKHLNISHGICMDCYAAMKRQIKERGR